MKYVKVALLLVAVTLFVANTALAELNFSANIEFNHDLKMTTTENGNADGSDAKAREQSVGGRVSAEVNATKTLDSGLYAKGIGVWQMKLDGTVGMDNARLNIGNTNWFVSLGKTDRLGTDGKGQDIYIVDAPSAPGRYQGVDVGERGASLWFMPSDTMKVNFQLYYEGANKLGARPTVQVAAGPATIKVTAEYKLVTPTDTDSDQKDTTMGGGAYMEVGMGSITLGGFGMYRIVGGTDAAGADLEDAKTMSGFGWVKLAMGNGTLGLGGGYDKLTQDGVDDKTGAMGYVSYSQGKIGGIDGLKLSVAASFASADTGSATNSAFGGRVRVNFDM